MLAYHPEKPVGMQTSYLTHVQVVYACIVNQNYPIILNTQSLNVPNEISNIKNRDIFQIASLLRWN